MLALAVVSCYAKIAKLSEDNRQLHSSACSGNGVLQCSGMKCPSYFQTHGGPAGENAIIARF